MSNPTPSREAKQLSLKEVADRLGVHYMTAYRYVRTGHLEATRTANGWLVDPAHADALRAGLAAANGHHGREAGRPAPGRSRSAPARAGRLERRLVAGDEPGAWAILVEALVSGSSPEDVYLDLLGPALRCIGDRWASGELDVGDEHRAACVAERLIGRMGPRFLTRGQRQATVVVAAPAGDRHAIPVAMATDLLRRRHLDVVSLGADAPAASVARAAVDASRGRLMAVVLGATTPGNEQAIRTTVAAVRAVRLGAPVGVGGAAIGDEDCACRLGADLYTGTDGRSLLAALSGLTGS